MTRCRRGFTLVELPVVSSVKRAAFTLVELLVVIGIIAALIGILLPVLSSVQARGRDLKCQSNLKQIVTLFLTYAAENKGSLPFGWMPMNWDIETHPSTTGDDFISWASIVTQMSRRKASIEDGLISSPFNAPFLKCPEAALVYNQLVTYVVNISAMPGPYDDLVTQGGLFHRAQKLSGLFPHNILVHDTSVSSDSDESVGYLTSADVDNQRIWDGAVYPQWRYFDPSDRYARLLPGTFANNRAVGFPTSWKNIDPTDISGSGPGFPYQGNLRFRHVKDTTCFAAFADGHVGPITAKINADRSMKSHDGQRKLFLTKWPAGMPRSPAVP